MEFSRKYCPIKRNTDGIRTAKCWFGPFCCVQRRYLVSIFWANVIEPSQKILQPRVRNSHWGRLGDTSPAQAGMHHKMTLKIVRYWCRCQFIRFLVDFRLIFMPKAMNFKGFLTDSDFWSALVHLRNGMKGINDKQLCDLTGYLVVFAYANALWRIWEGKT